MPFFSCHKNRINERIRARFRYREQAVISLADCSLPIFVDKFSPLPLFFRHHSYFRIAIMAFRKFFREVRPG